MSSSSEDHDEDEQIDWEEVDVDLYNLHSNPQDPSQMVAFDIIVSTAGDKPSTKKRSANSALERQIRHQVHRTHIITLLVAGLLRNRLLNDGLLKARLLSLVPLPIINAFNHFSPETHPLARDRSRLFDSALKDLVSWWWQTFKVNDSFKAMISRSWSDAESLYNVDDDANGTSKLTGNTQEKIFFQLLESGEPLHGVKSLMKHALLMKGSRDMSAQLFTSCLRALNIPARLVFSLQPVTWRGASAGGKSAHPFTQTRQGVGSATLPGEVRSAHKPQSVASVKSKLKPTHTAWTAKAIKAAKAIQAKSLRVDDRIPSYSEAGDKGDEAGSSNPLSSTLDRAETSKQGSFREAPVRLRKAKPKAKNWTKSPSPEPYEMNKPPVFWTEVYSRPLKEWYCVDVTRKRIRCKNIMEPSKNNAENKMIYVIAFEEDHFIRDVTARYAHSFGATTMKARLPSKKNGTDWFDNVAALLKRPYKLSRDVEEDIEIEKAQVTEAMPTTVIGFKNHPKYALERHLRREEIIYPKKSIGTFRGDNVYPRSSVVTCKTAENYMREGKRIKGGENPLKMVTPRTVTIKRRRETELLKMDGLEVPLQGLFAEWQTELLIPPPIDGGVIPRNAYGNFDLFAPHMLPRGAKHLPYKGIAKIAKKLRVSYADAVVSFEFHRNRATPVIDGIIVPELEAEFVLDAYWSSEEALEVRERQKLEERCLKRWKKLIVGLRIRHRLQEEYQNQVSRGLESQKPVEGTSQLTHVDIQQEEIFHAQNSCVNSALKSVSGNVPFELYTDHQMNPMRMTQMEQVVADQNPEHADPVTSNLQQPTLSLSPSYGTNEVPESSIRNQSRADRVEETRVSIEAYKSKGIKRKNPPLDGSNQALHELRELENAFVVPMRNQRTTKPETAVQDSITSSPLTSPPLSPESNESDLAKKFSSPKRTRTERKEKRNPVKPSSKIAQKKTLRLKPNCTNNRTLRSVDVAATARAEQTDLSSEPQVNTDHKNSKSNADTSCAPTFKRNLRPRK